MKKLLLTLFITLCTLGISMAQDLEKATELYNTAATTLNEGNTAAALDQFQQALKMAETLGEEGTEIVSQCKGIIPKLYYAIGKDYAAAKDLDNAIATLKKAVEVAKEYGDTETLTDAQDLMPQILMADAGSLLNEKKFAEAAAAYKKVIAVDPENGMAFLRMGMALAANNDTDAAVEALTTAMSKGQEDNAKKQLSNIFLKKAVACQRAKDAKGALEAAQKSVEYVDNANGQKIIGLSAITLKQNKVAAEALEAYLAMQPEAKDKVQITYQLGTALMGAGLNDKACGYFKQIVSDPKWGEAAKYQVTTLKCN
ncbi:MAG: tetratricopeptide repeat protein [Bacteroidales bacterium]|mgnify:CR=1 FL=1|nr:tetratricopeptide repeat protein [Bacteroidales bacterium]MDD4670069.1 tetratricopeptide repeat protein [Bacteroidales bacterium]